MLAHAVPQVRAHGGRRDEERLADLIVAEALASRRMISHSRSVSSAAGSPPDFESSSRAIVGSTYVPPAAATVTARTSSSSGASLSTKPSTPSSIARSSEARSPSAGEDDGARLRRDARQLLDHLEPVAVAEAEVDERDVGLVLGDRAHPSPRAPRGRRPRSRCRRTPPRPPRDGGMVVHDHTGNGIHASSRSRAAIIDRESAGAIAVSRRGSEPARRGPRSATTASRRSVEPWPRSTGAASRAAGPGP